MTKPEASLTAKRKAYVVLDAMMGDYFCVMCEVRHKGTTWHGFCSVECIDAYNMLTDGQAQPKLAKWNRFKSKHRMRIRNRGGPNQ